MNRATPTWLSNLESQGYTLSEVRECLNLLRLQPLTTIKEVIDHPDKFHELEVVLSTVIVESIETEDTYWIDLIRESEIELKAIIARGISKN